MKKLLVTLILLFVVITISSCRETTQEKTEEAVEAIGEDVEDAAKETGEAIQEGADELNDEIQGNNDLTGEDDM